MLSSLKGVKRVDCVCNKQLCYSTFPSSQSIKGVHFRFAIKSLSSRVLQHLIFINSSDRDLLRKQLKLKATWQTRDKQMFRCVWAAIWLAQPHSQSSRSVEGRIMKCECCCSMYVKGFSPFLCLFIFEWVVKMLSWMYEPCNLSASECEGMRKKGRERNGGRGKS